MSIFSSKIIHSSTLKNGRLQGSKIYVSYTHKHFKDLCARPKTNAAILWDMGHTKGRPYMGGIEQGKETKNLNVYRNLKLAGATMRRGLGKSEEDW
jgi:hypothetical protein